jgi:hypothetical protein
MTIDLPELVDGCDSSRHYLGQFGAVPLSGDRHGELLRFAPPTEVIATGNSAAWEPNSPVSIFIAVKNWSIRSGDCSI